ncbi:MAG: hypothetical protein HY334_00755 [Armatimonadetes bacterium]|nr:hypothetical protein [Armatimonadota bacterium]
MDRDSFEYILGRLERPVTPSTEFAQSLLGRLLQQLEAPQAPALWERAIPLRPRWLPSPFAVTGPRLLVLVALALGLLAAVAAGAYYVSVQTWLSSGPRGVQFTSDFELVELFRADEFFYSDFTLGPEGNEIYALRQPTGTDGIDLSRPATLVRLDGLQDEQLQTEEILTFSDLTDPALWDPGTDLSGIIFPALRSIGPHSVLSVADNGDVFLVASAFDEAPSGSPPHAHGTSVIVRRPDGTPQKVLTAQELVDAGLLDTEGAEVSVAVVSSAPDFVWLKTEMIPSDGANLISFYQVQDPDADGDWSDRTVLPLALPPSLPGVAGFESGWLFTQMLAEPSVGGQDRSRSLLLAILSLSGEYRIYRVSDFNGDGDAADDGELDRLFTGTGPYGFGEAFDLPVIAPRVVLTDGKVVLRELVAGSLARASRLSRISESGEVTDIARAFEVDFGAVLAGPEGNIYVAGQLPGTNEANPVTVIYRLRPVSEEEAQEAAAATAEASPTEPAAAGNITPGIPRIAFQQGEKGEVFLVGLDGSGPEKLLEAKYILGFEQSPGGKRIVYWSDEEVPRETFTYVANADGSNPKKLRERIVHVSGWPSEEDSLILSEEGSRPWLVNLILHDIESGRERTLLTGVDNTKVSVSLDGGSIAFVSGSFDYSKDPPTGAESLEVLDIETGQRRRVDGPLTEGSYGYLQWSSDGRRMAYFVDSDLYVRDIASGEARPVYRVEGYVIYYTWSPSGRWFLIEEVGPTPCTPEEEERAAEEGERARLEGQDPCPRKRALVLVNVESGETREVVNDEVDPANTSGWPTHWVRHLEDSFVVADPAGGGAYLHSATGGVPRPVPDGGWSSDGRYILFSRADETDAEGNPIRASIAVFDTDTGETRTLIEGGSDLGWPRWWR